MILFNANEFKRSSYLKFRIYFDTAYYFQAEKRLSSMGISVSDTEPTNFFYKDFSR